MDNKRQAHVARLDIAPRLWGFHQVQLEAPFDGLRADALLTELGEERRELLVEVRVSHAVEPAKVTLARQNHLAMIEIDLQDLKEAEDREPWLTGSAADAKAVLKPYPQDCMVAYQVSTRVNSPENNDAALIEPIDNPISDDPTQMPLIQ